MSPAASGPLPYHVVYSERVRQRLLALADIARERGDGEANFLKAHLSLIELLDQIHAAGVKVRIRDDSRYAKHRDVDRLLRSLRDWDAIVAKFVGNMGDALGEQSGSLVAPIKDRPDFEHLEAKGISVLRKIAARQRRRKKDFS